MNEQQNGNECGKAMEVKEIKKDVSIGRFAHFKRLRDRSINQPTDGRTWTWTLLKTAIKVNVTDG